MSLLDVAGFTTRTLMPSAEVAYLEASAPGYLAARLAVHSSKILARLRKRYAPLVAPYPEIILGWLVAAVQFEAYLKRGIDAADAQFELVKAQADLAGEELKEAADGEVGLFDIPLRENTTDDGIARGTPLSYAEASPFDWADAQREALRGR